jgi:hypothetical protein
MILLCDIDHTITDAAWRDPWLGQWETYHPKSVDDKPIMPVIKAVNAMALLGWQVVLLTSRNERWRQITLEWLVKHKVLASGLVMRPEDSYLPCHELKIKLAIEIFGPRLEGIGMVWDNSAQNLEPFQELGITTMQVNYLNGTDDKISS